MRNAFGNFVVSIRLSTTQGWISGILARAMIGVVASASPELSGPQIACTLDWLINSWVAFTALVGSPWVSRITTSILRPLTPPAPLMASTAKFTPRLKPMVGAELGPVIAARQPILIGSDWAIAGFGNEKLAAPSAPALPNRTSRRETAIKSSRFMLSAPVIDADAGAAGSGLWPNPSVRIKFEPDVDGLSRASAWSAHHCGKAT